MKTAQEYVLEQRDHERTTVAYRVPNSVIALWRELAARWDASLTDTLIIALMVAWDYGGSFDVARFQRFVPYLDGRRKSD